ncbi:serine hydrolase domain-containing protein [Woeseia oceani]|uniref:Beta-lactamase-related domain-containing protein n=1 Tax=Woeseia oceani TaxID=1548547 RepID=A0A193LDM2_9GAMM|nr:serine hydrolase domain-containing protein [Woeseia oceani]ANO50578.1 hypothetical protein BA177_04530 [Woeseia oceani]
MNSQTLKGGTVSGYCKPDFSDVQAAFTRNFTERGEAGASLCVILRGEPVIDLWGGSANSAASIDWQENTITRVFSCTKGAVALCVHMLADAGALDLYAPVSKYWPEFQKDCTTTIPVWMLLNHQAGLPALRKTLTADEVCDSRELAAQLAQEPLFWEPGTTHGYHALSFGALLNELIFRITGLSVRQFFQREIAEPLDLDFWIGLPPEEEPRVAPTMLPNTTAPPASVNPVAAHVRNNLGAFLLNLNDSTSRAAEMPAGGGITNARSLARLYAPLSLDGSFAGKRLLSADALARMAYATSASGKDQTLGIATCFTLGFAKSWGLGRVPAGTGYAIGERAFGHPGMGGSIAFADPAEEFSFAYTMNQMNGSPSLDDRAQTLIDEMYKALGYQTRDDGFWR